MQMYYGELLEDYKRNILEIKDDWKHRDFVNYVRRYFENKNNKVLAISGLRGTGKTTGILQAAENLDCLYITAQSDEVEMGEDYITIIKETDKKYIILDEYSWIKDRENLDKFLSTAVENGKRIVITGTESITLDFLNYGSLIHRVDIKHVTLFTYDEYCRIYERKPSKEVCLDYLLLGGVFKSYQIKNFDSMQHYIKTALVDNLVGYTKNKLSEERAKQIIYTVFYRAICSSTQSKIKQLYRDKLPVPNYFDLFGIDTDINYPEEEFKRDIDRVSDIFEQIGVIVKIPNVVDQDDSFCKDLPILWDKTPSFKTYVVNPSLTCQLIKAIYGLDKIDKYILGLVFEACTMSYLATYRLEESKLFFYEIHLEGGINSELDALIAHGENNNLLYLFESKLQENTSLEDSFTIRQKSLYDFLRKRFPNGEVDGRFVVCNSKPTVYYYDNQPYMFINIGGDLSQYIYFEELIKKYHRQINPKNPTGNGEGGDDGDADAGTSGSFL